MNLSLKLYYSPLLKFAKLIYIIIKIKKQKKE